MKSTKMTANLQRWRRRDEYKVITINYDNIHLRIVIKGQIMRIYKRRDPSICFLGLLMAHPRWRGRSPWKFKDRLRQPKTVSSQSRSGSRTDKSLWSCLVPLLLEQVDKERNSAETVSRSIAILSNRGRSKWFCSYLLGNAAHTTRVDSDVNSFTDRAPSHDKRSLEYFNYLVAPQRNYFPGKTTRRSCHGVLS